MDVRVELSRILITELGDQQVIFLKERDGERSFPILIGIAEALAIDRRLKGHDIPRPLTHELLNSVIEALGGHLEKIVVNDIREQTFIATLHLRRGTESIEVDSRPSDAIALAVGMDTPIYVSEHVFRNILNDPSTPAERLNMLRARQDMLGKKIEELSQVLGDGDFLGQAPENLIHEYRHQLDELKTEYDAIERVLRKLG